ncbi:MAG: tRNA lysidine(34) synthetase TilS [Hyphomicrobiales bacterium]|nr:MAG: tRNA lysidine(34) synthetase TilS [Hyphomicrobiales bacterium]
MPGVIAGRPDPAAIFAPLDEFSRLGLAVSGGADSLALMLLAARYADTPEARQRFFVYSVDHGLRPEAADEVAFVVAEAERLGFAARALRWEGDKPATGLQQAARKARYTLIAQAMDADRVPVLVTAHHMADQAETVLMRLAHGSGVEGLRGMDYFTELGDLKLVRPLLGVDPDQLKAIVAEAGLVPVTDPSNADLDYERVRWRQALPLLTALGLDPQRVGRFAERMRDADRALEQVASHAFAEIAFSAEPPEARFARDWLRAIPHAVAVRVVARTLDRIGGGQKPHALAPSRR